MSNSTPPAALACPACQCTQIKIRRSRPLQGIRYYSYRCVECGGTVPGVVPAHERDAHDAAQVRKAIRKAERASIAASEARALPTDLADALFKAAPEEPLSDLAARIVALRTSGRA